MLIQFVSLTGITGIIFVLGTLQALAVNMIARPKERGRLFAVAVAVVLVFAAANMVVGSERPVSKLKVAAVGWTNSDERKAGGV